ncbi:MAG: hypothetical protein LBI13_06805 [Streptococcaceae bacterium]|jgi:hypothetical protein|nr:hypothetical protein [Streptococcaceae bacterium]
MMKDFNISDFVEMTDEKVQEINGGIMMVDFGYTALPYTIAGSGVGGKESFTGFSNWN